MGKLDTADAVLMWAERVANGSTKSADGPVVYISLAVIRRMEENERLRQAFERICKIGPNTRDDLFISHMRDAIKDDNG